MGYEYIKDYEVMEKSEREKRLELTVSILKAKKDLEDAVNNFEYAEGNLIDYFLYEIKANQAKLDYLLGVARNQQMEMSFLECWCINNKKII